MTMYVVMQGGVHPVAIIIPSPKAVFSSRKKANEYIKARRDGHLWYVRKVADMTGEKL